MNRNTAKNITISIMDRWANLVASGNSKRIGLEFMAVGVDSTQSGRREVGYVFSDRSRALLFARRHFRENFSVIAITGCGSADIAPV